MTSLNGWLIWMWQTEMKIRGFWIADWGTQTHFLIQVRKRRSTEMCCIWAWNWMWVGLYSCYIGFQQAFIIYNYIFGMHLFRVSLKPCSKICDKLQVLDGIQFSRWSVSPCVFVLLRAIHKENFWNYINRLRYMMCHF